MPIVIVVGDSGAEPDITSVGVAPETALAS